MKTDTCKTCAWWLKHEPDGNRPVHLRPGDVGECRRHAPRQTAELWADWAITHQDAWCGEWEGKG